MESIIIFIIIIIVFNLFRRLAEANRGRQTGSRRQTTAASKPLFTAKPTGKRVEDPFFQSTRLEGSYADYDHGKTHNEGYDEDFQDEEGDEYPTGAIKEETKDPEHSGGMRAVVRKSSPPTAVSKNLRQILNNKNSLVAAFVFHEIIESPLGQNKSRKRAFNRHR